MTRILPGVYASLYDLSTIPEGASSLSAAFVLKANRGPVGEVGLVLSPTDFLTRYTFNGYPSVKDDPTYWTILRTLSQTNRVYISRVAKDPLYGGLVVRREKDLGTLTRVYSQTVEGIKKSYLVFENPNSVTLAIDDVIRVFQESNEKELNGRYTVASTPTVSAGSTVVEVKESISKTYDRVTGSEIIKALKAVQPVPISTVKIGSITGCERTSTSLGPSGLPSEYFEFGNFKVSGDERNRFLKGDQFTVTGTSGHNGTYTVLTTLGILTGETVTSTAIIVKEEVASTPVETSGEAYRKNLANPEGYEFGPDDLFLVYGTDPGEYNSRLAIGITSSFESPDDLAEKEVMSIEVVNADTNLVLESGWLVSREEGKKALDGSALYIEEVINNSSLYIKVKNNDNISSSILPANTVNKDGLKADYQLSGGSNGADVETADYVGALDLFSDKVLPISLIGNGSVSCENPLFQQALISLVTTRTDCMAFLNSRKSDEKASLPSVRAQNIVNYKKQTLANTSFYACMYAPHVKVSDVFNSRTVEIGADGVAIPGWLQVVRNSGYPYAYAGPSDGLVSGVVCDWKIGDMSGEAEILNDASVNYIAFDAKVGRYYMQCQNTLQIANSAMRNIGTVLNILDIKETFMAYFKEFLQKPITSTLRKQILDQGRNYMEQVMDAGRCINYALVDATTDYDLADNTLRYVLTISPTPYAQKIFLTMNVVNATYDFSIVQGGQA